MSQSDEKKRRIPGFTDRLSELADGRSNSDFAADLGISKQSLGFYMNGDRLPDAVSLAQICRACHVSADWLLGLSDVKSTDTNLRGACAYTGLTEDAASILHRYSELSLERAGKSCTTVDMLSKLLTTKEVAAALVRLCAMELDKMAKPQGKKSVKDYFESEEEYIKALQPLSEKGLYIAALGDDIELDRFRAKQFFSEAIDRAFGADSEA